MAMASLHKCKLLKYCPKLSHVLFSFSSFLFTFQIVKFLLTWLITDPFLGCIEYTDNDDFKVCSFLLFTWLVLFVDIRTHCLW